MKCSIIFIALVGAVSSNYAAATDHPNMNMLRGIIPAEELLANCPVDSCSTRTRGAATLVCQGFCDDGASNGVCSGAAELCGTDPTWIGCNKCCVCPGGGGSDKKRTGLSGSCKRDNSSPDEFLTTDEELELDCDCDEDTDCEEGYSCKNKNRCGGTDNTDPTETSEDVKAEYRFEE